MQTTKNKIACRPNLQKPRQSERFARATPLQFPRDLNARSLPSYTRAPFLLLTKSMKIWKTSGDGNFSASAAEYITSDAKAMDMRAITSFYAW